MKSKTNLAQPPVLSPRTGPDGYSRYLAIVMGLAIAAAAAGARAAETVLPVTPPGATDIDQALLPPAPGLYGGMVLIPFSNNSNTYDTSGNALPPARSIHLDIELVVPALLYVYPFKLFGGTMATSFIQPLLFQHTSIGTAYSETQNGLGDAYSDVLDWTKNVGLLGATPGRIPLPYGLNRRRRPCLDHSGWPLRQARADHRQRKRIGV